MQVVKLIKAKKRKVSFMGSMPMLPVILAPLVLLSIVACADNTTIDTRIRDAAIVASAPISTVGSVDDDISAPKARRTISVWHQQDSHSLTIINDDYRITIRGEVQFSPDDKAIASISAGGRLEYHFDDQKGIDHQLVVRGTKNKEMQVSYFRGGEAVELDDQGEGILAQLLPRMLKESAFDAKARVKARLQADGYDGVRAYITSVDSDGAASEYIYQLLSLHRLTKAQWLDWLNYNQRFVQHHDLTKVLIGMAAQIQRLGFSHQSEEFVLFKQQVEPLEPHYQFEVYQVYATTMDYNYKVFAEILNLVTEEHYRAELLMALIAKHKNFVAVDIHDLVRLARSEHYKMEIYSQQLNQTWFDDGVLVEIMLAMDSDHYRFELLQGYFHQQQVNAEVAGGQQLSKGEIKAISYVESDHYKYQIFDYILRQSQFAEHGITVILAQLPMLSSDHYQAQAIELVMKQDNLSEAQISDLKGYILGLNNSQMKQILNRRMTKLEKS